MEEGSCDVHSDDDKGPQDKNKKRTVKTRAQVQALEKFYNEHKYPTESMKAQLAESIGLTEKQVSGWFCHRRLKDKKVMNGENHAAGRQDRSSGVIQDRGSGHRQDSCGSTKQGEDRNFDTREVESGRLTRKEFSGEKGNFNRMDNASSGSSSLRNMSNHLNGDPFEAASSRYLMPKFPVDVKGVSARPGPSGYLKVKGRVENFAITAVKRQLGKHYKEDGPPLGIEFDPLPPGAFDSTMQDPVDETYYAGDDILPTSLDAPQIIQNPKVGKGYESYSSMASYNSSIDGTSLKIPDSYNNQKFRQKTSLSNSGAYYPGSKALLELSGGSSRDIPSTECRREYQMGPRRGVQVRRQNHHLQTYGAKMREERVCNYNDVDTKFENEYSNLTMTVCGYQNSADKGLPVQIIKDGKTYSDRRITNADQVENVLATQRRTMVDFPQHQNLKRSSAADNKPWMPRVMRPRKEMPSSSSEDGESAETSSSMD